MTFKYGLGGIGEAFSSPNFRIFWIGNFTHTITVWLNRMALGWLTWELTHSGAWLGIMGAAGMLPIIICGPVGGVTADRFGHRFQLAFATYIGAVIALVMAVLVAMGRVTPETLLVLATLAGVVRGFNVPARSALVPSLVPRRHLSAAVGINSATFHGGNFLGPALGGLVITGFGITPAFLLYVLGEVIAATSFLLLNIEKPPPSEKKLNLLPGWADGARYTIQHRGILSLMAMTALMAVFLNPYLEMLPGMAEQVFARGPDGLALLTASSGAGALIGGFWIARRGRTEGLVRIHLTLLATAMALMIVFVATDNLTVSMAALLGVGFCLIGSHSSNMSLIQNSMAPNMRARVMSFNGVVGVGGPALGALAIGWAASQFGFRLPIGISAALALLAFALLARMVLSRREQLEAIEPPPPTLDNAAVNSHRQEGRPGP